MKLYLNDKERSMGFLQLMEVMLEGALNSSELDLDTTKLIEDAPGIIDPVEEFLDYYIQDTSATDSIDEVRKQWIKNALYSAKGAPQIFEIFSESFDTKIEYEYEFPVIEVLEFKSLAVSDVILFVKKFKELVYNLLYYTELNLTIKHLILNIIGELTQKNQIGVKGFIEVPTILGESNGDTSNIESWTF